MSDSRVDDGADRGQEERALVVQAEAVTSVAVRRNPKAVLAEAGEAARALVSVLEQKKKPVIMNGERYIEADDWQVIGRFYGLTSKIESTTFVTLQLPGRDLVFGFEAVAVLLAPDGREVSRAEASCLSDEDKWGSRPKYVQRVAKKARMEKRGNEWHTVIGKDGKPIVEEWYPDDYDPARGEPLVWVPHSSKPGKSMPYRTRVLAGTTNVPLFQMKSMAQTRAGAKVHRQVLSFVPVMAGFRPTPAEELAEYDGDRVDTTTGEIHEVEQEEPPQAVEQPAAKKTAKAEAKAESPKEAKEEPKRKGSAVYKGEKPEKPEKSAPPVDAVLVTQVEEGRSEKSGRALWKITYVGQDEQERVVITSDAPIADLASEAQRDKALARITTVKGKTRFLEVDEITIL